MTSTEIRPATPDLMQRFYGGTPKRTSQAIVAVRGERVLGVAGILHENGKAVAFTELSDEVRADKRLIVRAYRMLLPMLEAAGTVYALADQSVERSDVLLRHYGFEQIDERVWQWAA